MNLHKAIFIFFAGLVGAVMNALAGGGTFIGFPTLLFAGIPPISANVTNNMAMLMGSIASGTAYRDRLDVSKRILIPLLIAGICGGLTGALLLLRTPAQAFMRVIPWFLLVATLLFTFGKKLANIRHLNVSHEASARAILTTSFLVFAVTIYGGYFGAGMSIIVLAMLAAAGMADIHAMNALKSLIVIAVNSVAALYFSISGAVYWPEAAVMSAGAIIGGYFGANFAKRLPQIWVRAFVIVVGSGTTIYFFIKTY